MNTPLAYLNGRLLPFAEAALPLHDAGFVSGATPTNVVWLDEHQQPPSRFDLETIVDLVRPVPERLRAAAATTCAP